MASINGEEAAPPNINPLLLASALQGNCRELEVLFRWEDARHSPVMFFTQDYLEFRSTALANRRTAVRTARDVEEGVIPDGDIELHAVQGCRGVEEGIIPAGGDTAAHAVPTAPDVEEGVISDGNIEQHDVLAPRDVEEGVIPDGNTATDAVPAASDAEEGVDPQPAPLAGGALLMGVTPDGDTAFHAVARNGDDEDFLECADIIFHRDSRLLVKQNDKGDTPLHCAARAGNSKMVSHLIDLAAGEGTDTKLSFLRMENKRNETALHEAVRSGHRAGKEWKIGKLLMDADPELAKFPADDISPLYLAILLRKSTIALYLHHNSRDKILSYSGADGQNALHAAVLRDIDTAMVWHLLSWNMSLTTQEDKDGSTPLHFASAMCKTGAYMGFPVFNRPTWLPFVEYPLRSTLAIVFRANRRALYQADKNGYFPIHVAASVGALTTIALFLRDCPGSAGLRDAKGKTFLHVATEKGRFVIVSYVCGNPSLDWIVNLQDNDGNTALHLAIQAARLRGFCALFGHPELNLSLTNNQGETPHDLSRRMIPRGLSDYWNPENLIRTALRIGGANQGAVRWDKIIEKYSLQLKPEEEEKESERMKDASQKYLVASVLIASMAFSATFAIPGGNRADEHTNAGTPTLAGGYVFHAFIMATALAFICSSSATVGFMLAGVPMVSLKTRQKNFRRSLIFIASSVKSGFAAFALGVYMMLAPVARNTAIAVCLITPSGLIVGHIRLLLKTGILLRALLIRRGLFVGTELVLCFVMISIFGALWPFIVTFGWAAVATIQWRQIQSQQIMDGIITFLKVIGGSLIVIIAWAMLAMIQWHRLFFRVGQWCRSH